MRSHRQSLRKGPEKLPENEVPTTVYKYGARRRIQSCQRLGRKNFVKSMNPVVGRLVSKMNRENFNFDGSKIPEFCEIKKSNWMIWLDRRKEVCVFVKVSCLKDRGKQKFRICQF